MFSAFFAEIADVRKQIGDDAAFARWCWDELHLGLTVITRVSDVLTIVDAAKVKTELASARAAEQEQKRKERQQREGKHTAARADLDAAIRTIAERDAEISDLKKRLKTLAAAPHGFARNCARCGKPFVAGRPEARTCSGACRVALHRAR
jgi:hypothetical protein